ncbi:MAG: ComEC [Candidatus Wolfebacteria bacterium GW2011_GWC1_43_10]|uniref:ComEC n=2 Tax=Candidatus Wolfeibacteriota TaxID=1752735 RepID=A0A0G1CBY9_9BACT|nr:MAG: ComEC [Candidatus Wolfebacteria bacterium GW2011_GWC1_43_10]OGM90040.1 MAG: hypothetical protein A2108_01725 [Candidatus Wolfebacteria bacterium GWA1_42_9]
MTLGNKIFWLFLFFIVGVFLSSLEIKIIYLVLGELVVVLAFLFLGIHKSSKTFLILAVLSVLFLVGAVYENVFDYYRFQKNLPEYDIQKVIEGRIVSYPKSTGKSISFLLKTDERKIISVTTTIFDNFSYGDSVRLESAISRLNEKNSYLKKDGVVGTVPFPKIIERKASQEFSFRKELFKLRENFVSVFNKILNRNESSLMSGILLGQESTQFPSDLKLAMKNSGTTHLVALSGYNILILINAIYFALGFVFKRKTNFIVSLLAIVVFVIMTGGEASVVRAALMGALVLLAQNANRVYNFKNSVAAAAFAMILFNPKVIVFDVGFVLSFLALFGIVYLASSLNALVLFKNEFWDGVKKTFFETFSAQVMVIPVLAAYFGGFSLSGLLSNVIILSLVPITMLAGFLVGLAGMIFLPLAKIGGIVLWPLLSFETTVIEFFGSWSLVSVSLGAAGVVFYYLTALFFVRKLFLKAKERELNFGFV